MGHIKLQCITLARSRFIAMAYSTPSSTSPYSDTNPHTHVILIQSNPYPESITEISWSLISAWPRAANVKSDLYSSHVCHTDPQTGVFTMASNFSSNNYPSYPSYPDSNIINMPPRPPGGFQYTPPLGIGVGGAGGTWRDVGVMQGYEWGDVAATYDLFTWPGSSDLYHARIRNLATGAIYLAMLTSTAETMAGGPAMLSNVANYTLNPVAHGFPIKLAFANNSIYQLGRLIVDNRTGEFGYFLTQIPLESRAEGALMFELPKNLIAYDASAIAGCQIEKIKIWYSSLWETLYILCPASTFDPMGSRSTRELLLSQFKNGDKAVGKPINVSTYGDDLSIIQPIEVSNSSIWVYLSYSIGNQLGFLIDPGSNNLTSANPAYSSITIPEPFGSGERGEYTEERDTVLDNLSLIIAGAIVGFLLVMIAICYIPFRRRWRRSWRGKWITFKEQTWPRWMRKVRLKLIDLLKEKDTDNNNKNDADDSDSQALQGKRDISKDSKDGFNNTKFEEHSMTSLDGLEGCDKILVTDDMDLSGLENPLVMDVATGYMNGVRLEAHPRPGVVTSLSAKEKSGSSSGSLLSSVGGLSDSSPSPGHLTLVAPSAPSAPPLPISSEDNINRALSTEPKSPHKSPDTKLPI